MAAVLLTLVVAFGCCPAETFVAVAAVAATAAAPADHHTLAHPEFAYGHDTSP